MRRASWTSLLTLAASLSGCAELQRAIDEANAEQQAASTAPQTAPAPAPTASRPAPAQPPAGDIDRRIVGRWLFTSTYVSGEFSTATDHWTYLGADGTFVRRIGAWAAGNANTSVVGGKDDGVHGRWRAADGKLFALVDGETEWKFAASYTYVPESDLLRLVLFNGNREICERR